MNKKTFITCMYCKNPTPATHFVSTKTDTRLRLCDTHYEKFSYHGPSPFRVIYLSKRQRRELAPKVDKQWGYYERKKARQASA